MTKKGRHSTEIKLEIIHTNVTKAKAVRIIVMKCDRLTLKAIREDSHYRYGNMHMK